MPRVDKQNGPDWTDVMSYLSAFTTLHECTSWLDLSLTGTNEGTHMRVSVISVWPSLDMRTRARRLVTQVIWPNVDSSTLEGAILKLLVDHDYRTSREVYTQTTLPLA